MLQRDIGIVLFSITIVVVPVDIFLLCCYLTSWTCFVTFFLKLVFFYFILYKVFYTHLIDFMLISDHFSGLRRFRFVNASPHSLTFYFKSVLLMFGFFKIIDLINESTGG